MPKAPKKKVSKLSSMVATDVPYKPTPAEKAERRKWEVEDALRTVQRAEEIKKDGSLMKEVKSMAKEKMSELKKIC